MKKLKIVGKVSAFFCCDVYIYSGKKQNKTNLLCVPNRKTLPVLHIWIRKVFQKSKEQSLKKFCGHGNDKNGSQNKEWVGNIKSRKQKQ